MRLGGLSKKLMAVALSSVMVVSGFAGLAPAVSVSAADDTAKLRMIFTSDLHGQLTTEDYETGKVYTTGGLSRAATLIKKAKAEVNAKNSLLFDLGDVLFDYTTDYIYDVNSSAQQPMYTAMAKMGYDAITLGNHEFDYTLDYIQKQLSSTGMSGKVVLSNVTNVNTGAHIWAENKIITKNLVTESGKTISVKVGLIGETVPTLAKKRTNYTGVLNGEDIVKNVKKEVPILQKKGADIIVVLAHSGIGEQKPAELDANTGYALTKISGVDAVLCGHLHKDFPDANGTKYDDYPGVNKTTGIVNGKPLVQIENRGASIGMVDLNIGTKNNKPTITGKSTQIRKVNASTEVDPTINAAFGNWTKTFMADSSQILSEVAADTQLQNYFGTMEDNDAIQLLNNIKISYGLQYINKTKTQYKNLPVVAASTYLKYGSSDGEDYIDIQNQFKKANIYDLVSYRTGLYIYKMTGAQIREWMEWSAGGYEQAGKNLLGDNAPAEPAEPTTSPAEPTASPDVATGSAVSAGTADREKETSSQAAVYESQTNTAPAAQSSLQQKNALLQTKGLPSLGDILNYDSSKPFQFVMQDDYLTDWSQYFIFDGLEYKIDTTVAPRYDAAGKKINDTHRIVSLTRNGANISNTASFIVLSNKLPNNNLFKTMKPTILSISKKALYRSYIQSFIEKIQMASGTIKPMQDNNWSVKYSDNYNYIVQSGAKASRYLGSKGWIKASIGGDSNVRYYVANPNEKSTTDTTGPCLTAVVKDESVTNKKVQVLIQATDPSGIASVRYAAGKYTADNVIWKTASKINGNVWSCDRNGTFTICATDKKGNNSVVVLKILNINKSMLSAPVVDGYTNRKTKITGKAEAYARVYFKVEGGATYSTVATKSGTFSYKMPPQRAGKRIFVYVVDSKGMTSARTIVTVKRTGPNKPTLHKVKTNSKLVTGKVNDSYAYPMILVNNKTVYVPNQNVKALYRKSSFYKKKNKVKVGRIALNKNGSFTLTLPSTLKAGTKVELRTVDAVSRCSLSTHVITNQAVPIRPTISHVSNKTTKVKVYAYEKCKKAVVKIGKKRYVATKGKYKSKSKRYCYTVKIPRTNSTGTLKVYVVNVKGRSPVLRVHPVQKVPDSPIVVSAPTGKGKVVGKVNLVGAPKKKAATVSNTKTKVAATVAGKVYKGKVKKDGTFVIKIPKLKKGTKFKVTASNRYGKSVPRVSKVGKKK